MQSLHTKAHSILTSSLLGMLLVLPNYSSGADGNDQVQAAELKQVVAKVIKGESVLENPALIPSLERALKAAPADESIKEALGILYQERQNYGKALGHLKLLKKPGLPAVRALGLSYFESRDYRSALKYFKQLPAITSNAEDWERYCQTLERTGQKAEAAKAYEDFRLKHPTSEAGLDFLAEHYRNPPQKEKLAAILEIQLQKQSGSLSAKESEILAELSRIYGLKNPQGIKSREAYLKINPNDWGIAHELAKAYEAQGGAPKALEIYDRISAHFRDNAEFNLQVARLWANSDPNKALPYYREAARNAPRMIEIPLEAAAILEKIGQPERALAAYHQALEINPNHSEAKAKVMGLATQSKDSKWTDALAALEKKNPKDHALQFQLAQLFLARQDTGAAYAYLRKALAGSPNRPEYNALLPQVIYTDAQVLQHFQALQAAAKQNPRDGRLHFLVGRGYSLNRNTPRAAEAYAMAHSLDKNLLKGNRRAILDLHAAKNYSLSGDLAEDFLHMDPNDLEVRLAHAHSLSESGASTARLRKAVQGVISLDSYHDKWLFRLAELDLAAKDTADAVKHAQNWLRIFPDDKRAYAFLEPLTRKRAGSEALYITSLENLARLEPGKQNDYDLQRAFYLFETGNFSLAADNLSRLSKHFPDKAELWYRLGRSSQELGRENAAQHYRKAWDLDPRNAEYARRLADILNAPTDLKDNLALFKVVGSNNPTPEQRRKLAHAYFLNGDYAGAALQWDWFVNNRNPIALEDPLATESFLQARQPEKARLLLEKRLEKNPKDLKVLTQLAEIYKSSNPKKHLELMARVLDVSFTHEDYLLQMARAQEKSGNFSEALRFYSQWTFHNPDDLPALEAFHRLAASRKDTASLIDALNLLVNHKDADPKFRFQQAELHYERGGEISRLEDLVKANPGYTKAKLILIREYHNRSDFEKLAKLEPDLTSQAKGNPELLEALGDLYAFQEKHAEAGRIYYSLLSARNKDRDIFNKVLDHARKTRSQHLPAILKSGSETFGEDISIKSSYAGTLGNTAEALALYQGIIAKRPKDVEAVKKAVEIALSLKKMDVAAQWLNRWTQLDKNDPEPWNQLIALHTRANEKSKLAPALEGLHALRHGDLELSMRLGSVYEELRKPEKSLEYYRMALYMKPNDKAVRDKVVALLKSLRKEDELSQVLQEIQALDTSAHEVQFELAKIYLQKKDKDKAYAYLSMALNKAPDVKAYQALIPSVITGEGQIMKYFPVLERMASAKPNPNDKANAELFLLLGEGYFLKQQWTKSGEYYSLANRLIPSRILGNRRAVIGAFAAKDYVLAADLAERYLEVNPDYDMEVRKIQILSYERTGRKETDIRIALQHLLIVDRENAGGLLRLAELDLKAGDTAMAMSNIRSCLNTNPTDARGYKMLLSITKGKKEERVTYVVTLEKLINLDAENRAEYQWLLGNFYFGNEKFRTTATLLSEAVKGLPKKAEAWYKLGFSYSKLGMTESGVGALKHAYELEPKNLLYARAYGQTLKTDKEIRESLALFEFLAGNNPDQLEKRKLAGSYYLNGKYPQSARAWDDVLTDKRVTGVYFPLAAEAFLRTDQLLKSVAMYELRLGHEDASGIVSPPFLDTLSGLYVKIADVGKYVGALERIVGYDPVYKDFQLRLAKAMETAKRFPDAISHYGQWAARNPRDMDALVSFHALSEHTKDTASLESSLRYLVDLKKADVKYTFQLAELDFKFTGNPEPIEILVKKHPQYRVGRILLVSEYYQRYDLDRLRHFEKFMRDEREKERWMLAPLAETYAYQEKKNEANQAFYDNMLYRRDVGPAVDFKSAFEKAWIYGEATSSRHLTEVLRIGHEAFPQDLAVKYAYASALGRDPSALKLYGEILASNPADVNAQRRGGQLAMALGRHSEALAFLESWTRSEPQISESWKLLADAHAGLKNPAKQFEAMDRLVNLEPTNAELHFATAQLARSLGRIDKALEYYVRSHELKFDRKDYLSELVAYLEQLADGHLSKGELAQAADYYDILLNKKPDHAKASLYLGISLAQHRNFPSALLLLKQGAATIPQQPKPIQALAWKLTGMSLRSQGEETQAADAFVKAFSVDPSDVEVAIAKMELSQNLGLAQQLPQAFSDVVRLDSNNLHALGGLAWIRLQEKKYGDAASLYGRLAGIDPATMDHQVQWGHALFESGKSEPALKAYTNAWRHGERDPALLYNLSRIHHARGTLSDAQPALEELVVRQPQNHQAGYWLGLVHLEKGRLEKAGEVIGTALSYDAGNLAYTEALADVFYRLEDYPIAVEMLGPRVSELSPASRLVYAQALTGLGQEQTAMLQFSELMKKSPSAASVAGLAQLHLKNKRAEEARRLIESSSFKQDTAVRLALGQSLLALRERDKAGTIFAGLVKEDESNAIFRYNLGQAYLEQRKFDRALAEFQAALKHKPDFSPASFMAGECYLELGRLDKARDQFHALTQSFNRTSMAKGFQGLARAALAERKTEEARDFLLRSLEFSDNPAVMALLARTCLQLGDISEAEQWSQRSLEHDSNYDEGIVALAEVLLAQGQAKGAQELLQEGLTGNPRSCALYLSQAKVLLDMNNIQASSASSRYALSLCPDDPMSSYYAGIVADKSAQKDEAQKHFKNFTRLGGDRKSLPQGY